MLRIKRRKATPPEVKELTLYEFDYGFEHGAVGAGLYVLTTPEGIGSFYVYTDGVDATYYSSRAELLANHS